MTSMDSNFNFLCGRPHGAGPPPPIHMRPPEPDPLPLRVDVINGWPLSGSTTDISPFVYYFQHNTIYIMHCTDNFLSLLKSFSRVKQHNTQIVRNNFRLSEMV